MKRKFIILLSFFIISNSLICQNSNFISDRLYPSIINKNFYEINSVQFSGSVSFQQDILGSIISSKATESNLPYQFFVMFYREFDKNPSMNKFVQNEFKKGLMKLRDDVPFFDKTVAESDLISLKNFYEINGYHFSKIKFEFKPNPYKIENILTFHIEEGDKYLIDTFQFIGLESIDKSMYERIQKLNDIKAGSPFSEIKIFNIVKNINNYLREKGYFFSSFNTPKVEIDTSSKSDIVRVEFKTGNRFKIGQIDFIDSTNNQFPVVKEILKKQLEIKSGDWINPTRIDASKDNLLSLGTFELVAIDTTSQFKTHNDTTLNLGVYLFYRKEQEVNFGVSLNQTRIDNFVNIGLETSYRHRNFFGGAQEFSPFANVYLKDLGTVISNQSYEFEAQTGFKYAQPLLWTVGNSRVSFLSSFLYSYKLLNNYFKISSFYLPISFPVRFPKITYFNRASIDFNFLRENPENFSDALKKAYESSKTEQDSNIVLQAFWLYKDLSDYLIKGKAHIFTSNTIGISLTGDSRNNPFSPSRGYFTFIGLDSWNPLFFPSELSGLARYLRFQFNHNQFFKLSPTTVLALKGKFGSIVLMEDSNSYVPIDRQFFCGGPNSVRAWPSRQLRYTKVTSQDFSNTTYHNFFENFIGNGVLIEGSIEFRFGFAKVPGLNSSLQDALQNFKTTLFLDFGNAFHWYVDVPDYEIELIDYITKLAVGTGIGLRYETPIGPVRLDFAFPLYDPLKLRNPFSTMQFNFGIGHAF